MTEIVDMMIAYCCGSGLAEEIPEIKKILSAYKAHELLNKYGIIYWPNW